MLPSICPNTPETTMSTLENQATAKTTIDPTDWLWKENAAFDEDHRIQASTLKAFVTDGRPVYNALNDPDSSIVADYTDRLNPGTDQRDNIISWIETNGLSAGKRRFYFPAGHYRMSIGTNDTTNLDIRGYDNVEIFGDGMGQTVFHYPQDYVMNTVSKGFIRVGWLQDAYNTHIHDITIQNDPYATALTDDGTADFGWVYYPSWEPDTDYEAGTRVHSVADDFIIEYQEDATSASTEPTWAAGSMLDNTYDVEVQALADRLNSTTYSIGDHYKTTVAANEYQSTRGIARCHVGGDTAAAEVTLRRPSSDGAGSSTQNNGISNSFNAHNTKIERVEFVGISGFNEAGGTALGMTNNSNDGALVRDCVFRDFNYGTAIGGYGNGVTITGCQFYKTGGWGYQYGTYNAHGMYLQGGGHLIAFNKFDSHYYGLDIKTHNNASAQDLIGNKLIGNVHLNYGWSAIEILDPDTYTVTGNQNFIPQYSGIQSGTSATVMTDSTRSWTVDSLIGYKVYNTTDSSNGTIVSNTATTVTVTALAGGSGNTWVANDLYQIGTLTEDADLFVKDSGTNSGTSATVLTDSSQSWTTNEWVGYTVFNRTDGSSGRITANDATTITVTALAGGSDNSWDADDLYDVGSLNNLWTQAMSQQLMVSNCHFRIERSAYENWNVWGGHPGDGFAISCGSSGTIVTGCTFMDTYGLRVYAEDTTQDYDNTTVSMIATGCSFRYLFRHCLPYTGALKLSDSELDFRALPLGSSSGTSISMNSYSTIKGCRIFANSVTSASRYVGFIELDGKNTTFEDNFVSITGTGYIGFCSQNNPPDAAGCVIRNNRIIAPNADLYWYPNDDSLRGNLFEGNYWEINSWAYTRNIREQITFRNETGNLWGEMNQWLTGEVITVETSVYRTSKGHLVTRDGAKATDPADIFGFSVQNSDNASAYTSFICTSEKTWQWMQTNSAVTVDDYVILSASAGRVDPNGTTGATTEPTSGFYGIVYDVGTASAGAGRALVYIKHFNLPSGSVSDVAYPTGWDTDTTTAPSRNATFDKIDAMDTAIGLNTAKTSNATHTGDVTGSTGLTIADSAVTLAKMADMATASLLGRDTAGTGAPEVLSAADARTLLNIDEKTATRTQLLYIPASAMVAVTTNGATPGTIETTTNKVMVDTMDFITASEQYAQFSVAMPKSWVHGTNNINAKFFWSHPATTTNFGVVWGFAAVAFGNDDAMDAAFGTAVDISDTGGTTDDVYVTSFTTNVTIAGTPAAEDIVYFRVRRTVGHGSDDMAEDARLHGVALLLDVNATTDS